MKCPNCKTEIGENELACPNCKKVLRLKCSNCGNITKNTICEKCGSVILNKCYKCGKLNSTALEKCPNCGMDINASIGLRESVIEEFAVLTIDITNFDDIKSAFKSEKIKNQFKTNLYSLVKKTAYQKKLRTQFFENTFIIRFCKDYSFVESCKSAIDFSVFVAQSITEINQKLFDAKGIALKVQMAIQKRDIYSKPEEYKSGVNIDVVYSSSGVTIYNNIETIVDSYVYQATKEEYPFQSLSALYIKNRMVMFFELVLSKIIKPEDKKELKKAVKLPKYADYVPEEEPDESVLINFSGLNCTFSRAKEESVTAELRKINAKNPQNTIISIKGDERKEKLSELSNETLSNVFEGCKIVRFSCFDKNKYSAFGLLKQIVFEYYSINEETFLLNPKNYENKINNKNLLDLINMSPTNKAHPEDVRFGYFETFRDFIAAIPYKTIFVIEDFEYIDESSLEILKYIIDNKFLGNIGFVVSYSKDFSLHRQSHFLLAQPYYSELYMKPTPFEKMIEGNKEYYKNILDDFYFHRIAKYSCGSILFLDIALQYLVESEVYTADDTTIYLSNPKTIIIPSSLNKLFKRRLNLMQDEPDVMKFLATVLLLGTRIDRATLNSLGYENLDEIIDKLANMGYLYFYNNCMYFPNYNLLRENLLGTMNKETLQEMANELFEKVLDESMPSPVKSYLYGLLGDSESQLKEWQKLMQVNLSLGDFNSYLNCANEILKILDKNKDEEKQEEIENYKLELYENISNNLYEYVPAKTQEIAEVTLENLEKTTNIDQIIQLCSKMIQGYMTAGDFNRALELMHKVLSLLPGASIDPLDPNFNQYLLLMSIVHIEILFNIGAMSECIDVGYRVLSIVNKNNIETVKPEHITAENFKSMIFDAVGYVAIANILQLQGNLKQFFEIVRTNFDDLPQSYDLFLSLESLVRGEIVQPQKELVSEDDKFSGVIFHVINAFQNISFDYIAFAEEIYQAKILAKLYHLHQIELCLDALIGYAYMKLESYVKASAILFKIIKAANINGMMTLLYLAWYLMCEMHLKQGKYNVAYGIVNNSLIQLEKNNNACEYLAILFRYALFKVFMFEGQHEKAQICIEQAKYMTSKYGINFEFDTDPSHYIPIEENAENSEEGEVQDMNDSDNDDDDDEVVGPIGGVPPENGAA